MKLPTALLALSALPLLAQAPRPARRDVPMDSARAAALYVSDRPEDHPQADFERQRAEKARTDHVDGVALSRPGSLLVHVSGAGEEVAT